MRITGSAFIETCIRQVHRLAGSVLAAIVIAIFVAGCCDDCATTPKPVGYNIYVGAMDWYGELGDIVVDPLYIIDADCMKVVDSIPNFGPVYDMEVSPDGRWLYAYIRPNVGACPDDSLQRIDICGKSADWAVPSGLDTRITLLDHGNLILRQWAQCSTKPGGRDLLDAGTGRRLATLADSINYQEGSVAGTEVAAILVRDDVARVVAVDVLTGDMRGEFTPRLSNGQTLGPKFARLHSDGETVLVMAGTSGNQGWAMLGNLSTGEVLAQYPIFDVHGQGAFSTDGSLAVTSEMNSGLTVFSVDSMVFLQRFSAPMGQVRFIGDSKRIVACGKGGYHQGIPPLVTADLGTLHWLAAVFLPLREPLLGAMAVGPKPE